MGRLSHIPGEQNLITTIRQLNKPLKPQETGTTSRLDPLPDVRAVLFDVYGTLFLSASGDIGVSRKSDHAAFFSEALAAAGIVLPDEYVAKMPSRFHEEIEASHTRLRAEGISHPEVDIILIWKSLIEQAIDRDAQQHGLTDDSVYRLAVEYECRQNPVWPMPGIQETLSALVTAGLRMGIVSNAQFYTPFLFPALLDANIAELGFDAELCAWSWMQGEAKPSIRLMKPVLEGLAREGISPRDVVVVGNDMLNDIQMAAAAGCRTVLFAGDSKSLRWRERHKDCEAVTPDAVITSLPELLSCLGLKA